MHVRQKGKTCGRPMHTIEAASLGASTCAIATVADQSSHARSISRCSAEVQRRIAIGRHAVSAQVISQFHGKAQSIRSGIQKEFSETFARADVLLTPAGAFVVMVACHMVTLTEPRRTAPSVAPLTDDAANMEPDVAYAHDVMTVPASLAGVPAISIPAGLDDTTGAPCCRV